MISSFFKTRSPKRFSIKPRHHDPDMEDLHRRVADTKKSLDNSNDSTYDTSALRGKIKRQWNVEHRKSQIRIINRRVFVIAAVLAGITYFYFRYFIQ